VFDEERTLTVMLQETEGNSKP